MNILFIGTVQFSKNALQKLIEIGAAPVGVITKKAAPFNADFAELSPICEYYNIPCRFVKDIHDSETIQWIKDKHPDFIFCFGWSSLLKKPVLNIPKTAVIGFHPAALPYNRGRHPIVWALAIGLTETASTFFFMDEGADSGDILSQEPVSIDYLDDAGSLYEKITKTALAQIQEFLPKLIEGSYVRLPQDHGKANVWRKRGKADGIIDFRMNSRSIYNHVRALSRPYVGAHVNYKGQEIKVWKVKECGGGGMSNIEPGKVLMSNAEEMVIKCGDTAIILIDHEFKSIPKVGEYIL